MRVPRKPGTVRAIERADRIATVVGIGLSIVAVLWLIQQVASAGA